MTVLFLLAAACVAYLFLDAYSTHRQTCREQLREIRTAAIVAVHRQDFDEDFKVMGGSGGRR